MTIGKTICSILLLTPIIACAQQNTRGNAANYPQDYFRNPLNIPIFLAGNFGECRPGHFHSGVDIKTKGKENEPVHAAADGYVSRIKMEKGGFGHGLYITHPNGYTTLYAHLNNFSPAIQKFVKDKQYEKQRWDVDLQLSPNQFPVKKGEQVAWSGNTGASTAPHLHFEIRNTKTEHPLNPELFGLPIADGIAPTVKEIALYSGNIYSVNPAFVQVRKAGTVYKPVQTKNEYAVVDKDTVTISAGQPIGVAINADDLMEGSDNTLTFYTAKLYMDDNLQAQVTLDDIGYDETRYINAYADYKTKEVHKKWLQCLFQLPGNQLNGIFSNLNGNKGRLDVADRSSHKVSIVLNDDKGNETAVNFYLRATTSVTNKTTPKGTLFAANKVNSYKDNDLSFTLDERQLYDDIDFVLDRKTGAGLSDKFSIHYPYVPLHHNFDLMIKANKLIPFALRTKVVLMYTDGKDADGRAAKTDDNGWYKAAVRNFGTYWLAIDTMPPVIKTAQKQGAILSKAKQILFTVKDATTSVKTFNGYIDDKWVCFEQHGSSFFYKFDEHCSKGKHTLVFNAADENGNQSTYKLTFTR